MALQIDSTHIYCTFCGAHALESPLVRSIHGLYCTNEHCYSRSINGNLVPASICPKCEENAFYFEPDGDLEKAAYQCIACGNIDAVD
ncbi:MAG: hypothetical protein KDD48_06745 [Bdellovibrionales bacterium]|nr:hypothetical protein [Bdellovibrionales bacterium]